MLRVLQVPTRVERTTILGKAAYDHGAGTQAGAMERHGGKVAHGEVSLRTQSGEAQCRRNIHGIDRRQFQSAVIHQGPYQVVPCHEHGLHLVGHGLCGPYEAVVRGIERRAVGVVEAVAVGDDLAYTAGIGQPDRLAQRCPCLAVGRTVHGILKTVVAEHHEVIAQLQDALLALILGIDAAIEAGPGVEVGIGLVHRRTYLIHLGRRSVGGLECEVDRLLREVERVVACQHQRGVGRLQARRTYGYLEYKARHYALQRRAVAYRVFVIDQSGVNTFLYGEDRLAQARHGIDTIEREGRQLGHRRGGRGGRGRPHTARQRRCQQQQKYVIVLFHLALSVRQNTTFYNKKFFAYGKKCHFFAIFLFSIFNFQLFFVPLQPKMKKHTHRYAIRRLHT